jgi:hypothetical protein
MACEKKKAMTKKTALQNYSDNANKINSMAHYFL